MEIFICSSGPISWIETIELDTIGYDQDNEYGDLEAVTKYSTMIGSVWGHGIGGLIIQ